MHPLQGTEADHIVKVLKVSLFVFDLSVVPSKISRKSNYALRIFNF